ncbi:PQQ-binding-like beta-propeller repeat protein [Streptomyces sparsogenes]|uniref:outer membrane protein assembly factor BamB family protein n=1 Tax=Streptomyces sparsogenes TaxID=67365 RepID=UPI000826AA1C|nr:PQQ-binding-like beta-propeller repeat protein [Streptomyces sparsogenes]
MSQPPQPPDRPPTRPTGGGREPGRRRRTLVIGAAVGALLAAGAGVWAAAGGGEPRTPAPGHARAGTHTDPLPAGPTGRPGTTSGRRGDERAPGDARRPDEAEVLFREPAPGAPENGADIPGFWVRDGHVVKAVRDKVIAYGDHGERKWTVTLRGAVCAAPESPTGGTVVIAYGGPGKDECGRLALIDLDHGAKLWDRRAPAARGPRGDHLGMGLAQSGDLAGLSWYGGSAVVAVGDGRRVPAGALPPGCRVDGFAGGRSLLRAYSCDDGTAGLQRLDTATGQVSWTYRVREGYKVSNIYSTDPVVVSLADDHHKSGGIVALSDRGTRRSTLDLGERSYQPECGQDLFGTRTGGCRGVAASSDTFYLPTELSPDGGRGPTNEIHAFDLRTGQRKWTSKVPGRVLLPLSVRGEDLIAYEQPTEKAAGSVVGVTGGRPKTLLRLPKATRAAEVGLASASRIYRKGTFYIASDRLAGSGADEAMIVAFRP